MNNMNQSLKELQHAGKWLAALASLRRDGAHCDVLLKAESMRNEVVSGAIGEANGVWAHRAVLAAISPYFYRMFYSSFQECSMQVVVLTGIKLDILRALVENIYSPKPLVLTAEKARAILAAATKLDVADVRNEACTCLNRVLATNNVLGIHDSAEQHNCTTLAITAKKYIHDHFQDVLRTDEFLGLSPESLITLLKTDRIATIEEQVFDSVLRWTQNRLQVRQQHLASILRFVRLPLVPRKVLIERTRVAPIVNSSSAILLVMAAMRSGPKMQCDIQPRVTEQHDMQPHDIQQYDSQQSIMEHIQQHNVQPRDVQQNIQSHVNQQHDRLQLVTEPQSMNQREIQPRVVEYTHQHTVQPRDVQQSGIQPRVMEQHDIQQRVMEPHCIQQREIESRVVEYTQQHNAHSRDVYWKVMQPHDMQQRNIQPLVTEQHDRQSRVMEQHAVQPHNIQQHDSQLLDMRPPDLQFPGTLLVLGGATGENYGYSNTVLACSLPNGRWRSARVLPAPRVVAGAALLDNRVYVVGGSDGPNTMRTVFVYDATTNTWLSGPSMNTARWWLGVAVLSGQLYAVGGRNGLNTINSAEALDPREGVWRSIANMTTHRGGLGVAALKGRLYAIGGHDGNMALNSTERYDQLAGRWEAVEAMTEQRMAVGVTVVGDAMYAVGGSSGTTLRSVEFYRAGLGWELAPPMAIARRGAAVTSHDGRLYVAGGTDDPNLISSVCMLNLATDMWSELPALPTGRWGAAAVVASWPPPPPL